MSADRDIERVLETWFTDGISQMPDRVYRTVIDRVDRQPQRHGWRSLPGRFPRVNTPLKLALVGAALVAALLAGSVLMAGGRNGVEPTGTATPAPTSAPRTDDPLDARRYTGHPRPGDGFAWTVTMPDGWSALGEAWLSGPAVGDDHAAGLGIADGVTIPANSCDPASAPPLATADDIVAALQARDDWLVSPPVGVTVSGFDGKLVDVQLPADVTQCGLPTEYSVVAEHEGNGIHARDGSNRLRFWVLDVVDTSRIPPVRPVVIVRSSFADTPVEQVAQADQIVESLQISP